MRTWLVARTLMMHLDDHWWPLTIMGVYGCLAPDISRLGAVSKLETWHHKYLNIQAIHKHSLILVLSLTKRARCYVQVKGKLNLDRMIYFKYTL